jgi:malonate-semialdehyde dehydrogenase (acetylating)/methylmalonate-semialdehyde dehydrogenase
MARELEQAVTSPVADLAGRGEDGRLRNYVAGAWREPAGRGELWVRNPADGAVLGRVPLTDEGGVDEAVRAAAAAFPAWAQVPPPERLQTLVRFKAVLEEHFEELATLVTLENGKTLDEARGEVRRGIEVVDFALGLPTLLMGRTLANVARGVDVEMYRVPLGVVAGVAPFNFPAMVPMWMFPIAIACGNTFVMKPSERVPLSVTRLAELFAQAGLPDGVFNVVHGDGETVRALITHPDVRAVSFVGSEPVAREVYRTASAAGKRVQALAGAKNHLVVMPDADLPFTVEAIVSSAYGNAGERCLAASVVVAVGEVADPLVAALRERIDRLRVGDGRRPETEMGPVITAEARDRIASEIERGLAEGARLVRDGRGEGPEGGFFLGPTLFDAVPPGARLLRTEIFGPVLAVVRVASLDEAIDLANRSPFGNAAAIFTRSGLSARTFRERIEAGMVGINIGVPAPVAYLPFAGWKHSFYGDLHATGEDAVQFYTERRVVTSRWPAG